MICFYNDTREIDFKTLLHSRYFGEKMTLAVLKPVILNNSVDDLLLMLGKDFSDLFQKLEYLPIFTDEAKSIDTPKATISNISSTVLNCYFENVLQRDWFFNGLLMYVLLFNID
jgi:hypothetical protein